MKMKKRQFRIGELAKQLDVEKFVIRFWEKEFQFKTDRSQGGQRFYDNHDLEKFTLIKELLYKRGFTIAGAKKELFKEIKSHTSSIKAATIVPKTNDSPVIKKQITLLQKQLMKLRELL